MKQTTPSPTPSVPSELEQQLQQLQAELELKSEAHRRVLADYRNLELQSANRVLSMQQQACARLLSDLLPSLDHLRMAAEHGQDSALTLIVRDLERTLEQHGLKELTIAVGSAFDPNTAEAIEVVDGAKDTVVRVHQQAYALNGTVLRHAKVSVGNGNEA